MDRPLDAQEHCVPYVYVYMSLYVPVFLKRPDFPLLDAAALTRILRAYSVSSHMASELPTPLYIARVVRQPCLMNSPQYWPGRPIYHTK